MSDMPTPTDAAIFTDTEREHIEEMAAAAKAGSFTDAANDLPLLRRMLHEHTATLLNHIDTQAAALTAARAEVVVLTEERDGLREQMSIFANNSLPLVRDHLQSAANATERMRLWAESWRTTPPTAADADGGATGPGESRSSQTSSHPLPHVGGVS